MAPGAINYIRTYVHDCGCYLSIADLVLALKKISKTGVIMQSADSRYYQYFSIITSFVCDYEEQVVIIGIKSGMQCTICQVPFKK